MIILVRSGTKYGPEYVTKLIRQVRQNGPIVTLTDMDDTPGETRPLRCGFPGWWSKLELFAPWNEDLRPCLFLDLDTFVLGNIADLLDAEGFWMLRDLYMPERGASGVMILPKDTAEIWACLGAGKYQDGVRMDHTLEMFPHQSLQDEFEGIYSYKRDCRAAPKGRIICFHGKPRPHEAEGWAREYWNNCGASLT